MKLAKLGLDGSTVSNSWFANAFEQTILPPALARAVTRTRDNVRMPSKKYNFTMFKAATPIGRSSRASTAPAAPGTTLSSGRSSQLGSNVGTARRLFTPSQRVRFPVIPASYGPTPPGSASFSPPGSGQFSPPRSKPVTPKIAFQEITSPGSKQLSPPGSYQVTPPGSKQVTPPGSKQVTPPGSKQVTPPGSKQVTPPGSKKGTPPGSKPVSPPAKSASPDVDLPSSRTTPRSRQSLDDFFPKKPQIFWYDRYGFPKHLEVKKCRRSHTVDLLSDSTQVFPEAYIFQPYLL
ncbi:Hypp1167 [Branchiostoma lanceolatum]|uniref:Hypp1167 protein n=1 Tax=Branchiostoma lanceolatum TaxID=7740 RepID=A0A8J9ZFA6_BRALA|nr:Hypp1167 [Branchiostoma lanceolatum]